jgi:hypothetical protein
VEGLSGVSDVWLSYTTAAREHGPFRVERDKLLTMPGVVPTDTVPHEYARMTPVNVISWTLTCRDQETRSRWRASGGLSETGCLALDSFVEGVRFEMIEE